MVIPPTPHEGGRSSSRIFGVGLGFSTPSIGPVRAEDGPAEARVLLYVGHPSQPTFPPAPLHLPSPGHVPGVGRSAVIVAIEDKGGDGSGEALFAGPAAT